MSINLVLESTSVVEVRQKLKYDYYEVIIQSNSGEYYVMQTFNANNLVITDPKNRSNQIPNS